MTNGMILPETAINLFIKKTISERAGDLVEPSSTREEKPDYRVVDTLLSAQIEIQKALTGRRYTHRVERGTC